MKSIYDEVLDILLDSLLDPQDEDDDCYMLSHYQMIEIIEAIRIAQKQDKLLKAYEKLAEYRLIVINKLLNEIKDLK